MKKENKLFKKLKRDEIFQKNISNAGFVVFLTLIVFAPIVIITSLINNEMAFVEVKYTLTMIGISVLAFFGCIFLLQFAKREYFNKTVALALTAIASIYSGVRLFMNGLDNWWLFLIAWAIITVVIFNVVKIIFAQIIETLNDIN